MFLKPSLKTHVIYQITKENFIDKGGLLVVVFFIVHTWMFFVYRQFAVFGFDTGFYRRYILEPMTTIPHASVPGLDHTVILPRVFLDVVKLSQLPTDFVLYGGYIIATALLVFTFYLWVNEIFNKKTAQIAVLLVLLSPVYFHAYWYFLLKNFLGLSLFFLLLLLIRREQRALAIITAVCIPITHQSTTIIAGIVLFIIGLWSLYRKEKWYLYILSWTILTALYLVYHPTIASKLSAPPQAIFLDGKQFIFMVGPLFFVFFFALWKHSKEILTKTDLVVYLSVTTTFILFALPYHERVFFLVIFPVIAVSARGLSCVENKKIAGISLVLGCVWLLHVVSYTPYFSQDDLYKLKDLERLTSEDHVIVPNYLAPWAHGYTLAEVYAPGVFKDVRSSYEWEEYWAHSDPSFEDAFIGSFPRPLYFFVFEDSLYFLPQDGCLVRITDALYKYACYNDLDEK